MNVANLEKSLEREKERIVGLKNELTQQKNLNRKLREAHAEQVEQFNAGVEREQALASAQLLKEQECERVSAKNKELEQESAKQHSIALNFENIAETNAQVALEVKRKLEHV